MIERAVRWLLDPDPVPSLTERALSFGWSCHTHVEDAKSLLDEIVPTEEEE